MQAKEAARLAIAEFNESQESSEYVTAIYNARNADDLLETMILRAFALAGHGWRDIAEAKKDGTVYKLYYPTLEGCQRDGYWSETQNEWRPLSYCPVFSIHQPTKFHEMPSDPRDE